MDANSVSFIGHGGVESYSYDSDDKEVLNEEKTEYVGFTVKPLKKGKYDVFASYVGEGERPYAISEVIERPTRYNFHVSKENSEIQIFVSTQVPFMLMEGERIFDEQCDWQVNYDHPYKEGEIKSKYESELVSLVEEE